MAMLGRGQWSPSCTMSLLSNKIADKYRLLTCCRLTVYRDDDWSVHHIHLKLIYIIKNLFPKWTTRGCAPDLLVCKRLTPHRWPVLTSQLIHWSRRISQRNWNSESSRRQQSLNTFDTMPVGVCETDRQVDRLIELLYQCIVHVMPNCMPDSASDVAVRCGLRAL